MTDDASTTTFTITTDDGEADEVTVPAGLLEAVGESGQPAVETVGDVVALSFANRAHHIAHHGEGDHDLAAEEAAMMDLFEDRFGVTFAEATGHHH